MYPSLEGGDRDESLRPLSLFGAISQGHQFPNLPSAQSQRASGTWQSSGEHIRVRPKGRQAGHQCPLCPLHPHHGQPLTVLLSSSETTSFTHHFHCVYSYIPRAYLEPGT